MPYNPGVTFRGDQYIAQGNQMAWSAVASLINNAMEQAKQTKAAGKAADFYVQANPKALEQMGMVKEQWELLGAKDKAQAVKAYNTKLTLEEVAQRISRYKQQAEDEETAGKFAQNFFNAPGVETTEGTEGRAPTVEERFRYAAKSTPNLQGRQMPQIIRSLVDYGELTGGKPMTPYQAKALENQGRGLELQGRNLDIQEKRLEKAYDPAKVESLYNEQNELVAYKVGESVHWRDGSKPGEFEKIDYQMAAEQLKKAEETLAAAQVAAKRAKGKDQVTATTDAARAAADEVARLRKRQAALRGGAATQGTQGTKGASRFRIVTE